MRVLVGIDLLPDCEGALEFAHWFHEWGLTRPEEVMGVCVVEEASYWPTKQSRLELVRRVEAAAADQAVAQHVADAFGSFEIKWGTRIDRVLAEEAERQHAMLIVGRQKSQDESRVVRLGSTARRLLRALPTPVAIVPPDFHRTRIPEGPVLVAIDVSEDSLGAVALGRTIAAGLDRPCALVHVFPPVPGVGIRFLSRTVQDEARGEHAQRSRAVFDEFIQRHELGDLSNYVMAGPVLEAIEDVVRQVRPCLLLSGSRRLSLTQRVFGTSVGSHLAAESSCPVIVTPPDFRVRG